MASDITVKWYRAGTLQSNDVIPMQLDNMSPREASYYGGTQPYFMYTGYVDTTAYAFQFKDLLIDTTNIDGITGQLARYRIAGDPEFFTDNHVEIPLDRMVGS